MRKYINNNWYFKDKFETRFLEEVDLKEFEKIRVPHTVKEIPYNYVNNSDYQMISCYYQEVDLKEYKDKNVFLVFDAVAHKAEVYLNGKLATTHLNGYTRFSVKLNDYFDKENKVKIIVKVDSNETLNLPPFGHVIDYLTYGGIYRDTYIEIKNDVYFEDVFLNATMNKNLVCNFKLNHNKPNLNLRITLGEFSKTLPYASEVVLSDLDVKLWDVDNPNLYDVVVTLLDEDIVIDEYKTHVGFRTISKNKNNILLNNKVIKIRGLNRHQAYAYVGYAMPKRTQEFDAKVLKNELGLNAVRTSHYNDSQYFIDECDRLGLLVFTEIPGWQYIGDSEWKNIAINNVKEMILQYRNHPSIFMWGVRINESPDDHDFYLETNKIARSLDTSRLIGGVRCCRNSELFEDVYTFNDFIHSGDNQGILRKRKVTKHLEKPLLITEYNGHMYPTKMFDDEIHRTNHLRRHLKVLNDVGKSLEHAGSFGWCMADYNTHKDFGSGDEICYHGVLDMFRNPKLASYAYSSQQDDIPVLEISSTMDIGEYPGGYLNDILVLTNLDKVKLFKGDEEVKTFYPNNQKYKGLKHPPILLDDLVGDLIEKHENFKPSDAKILKNCLLSIQKTGLEHMTLKTILKMAYLLVFRGFSIADGELIFGKYIGGWGDSNATFKIVGYKDDKPVKEIKIESFKELHFKVDCDETNLIDNDSYDVASIRIEALNQANNHLRYFQGAIEGVVSGPLEIIGPNIIELNGGFGGTYIKTTGIGEGSLKLYYNKKLIKEIKFNVSKN